MSGERRRNTKWLAAITMIAATLCCARAPQGGDAPATDRRTTEFVDDVGRRVELSTPLRRVVVFNRYTTEFVRAIGAMPSVVGFDVDLRKSADYWPNVNAVMVGRA